MVVVDHVRRGSVVRHLSLTVVGHLRSESVVPHFSVIAVGHVRTESAAPHLSLTLAVRPATTTRILQVCCRTQSFRKALECMIQGGFRIFNFEILNSAIRNFRILVVAAREWLATLV